MAATRAQQNRKIRQDALREQLAAQKHHEQVVETLKKVDELDLQSTTAGLELQRCKLKIDTQMRLVNKYLPDLKQQDITLGGDPESPLAVVKAEMTPQQAHDAYMKLIEG